MKPGEVLLGTEPIVLNANRPTAEVDVENTSDHTIFVSSHYPFFEVNRRLVFDRAQAWGMHLDIPAGDSLRWRPGERKRVRLVSFGGRCIVRGFNRLTDGPASPERLAEGLERVRLGGFGNRHPMLASDAGAPAPGGPAARSIESLASDAGAPAPGRPAARSIESLASDAGAPAPGRPPARTPGRE